ncbi:FAD-dependent oxidoreductase [Corynebacterium callunae]|uniref:FAD-dependent oxidoreductase n=1 Tax=Corynebacterium callunae TaxID=1721 RepID=UPI0039823C5F
MTQHQHHSEKEPWHNLPAGFADFLELEARLNAPLRNSALSLSAAALSSQPQHIVDLGSGTGANAIALAKRFPDAQVHALDVSAELLERVEQAALEAGVNDRVKTHHADLNEKWAAYLPTDVDLVWAALAMHHLQDSAKVIAQIFQSLRPGGVFALIEMSGETRFEPQELQNLMPSAPTHHLTDWKKLLEEAGFSVVHQKEQDFIAQASTPDGSGYVERHMRGRGIELEEHISKQEVSFRSGRTVWVAVRPNEEGGVDKQKTITADVAVIGGGPAGLTAAVALARSRRNVVVIDAGLPRNAPAQGAHNVLGNEGISPLELLAKGRKEAESYGVKFIMGQVSQLSGEIDNFEVQVGAGDYRINARRIILATGLVDDLPKIPGVEAGWGESVLHCPFCHGWEVRDRKIAICTRDEIAIHQVLLFGQLSDKVTVFLHDAPEPTAEQLEQLAALNIPLVRTKVEQLLMDGTQVRAVQLESGETFEADAVVVVPRFNSRTDLYESLGGTAQELPFGCHIPVDPRGMTPIAGVWAAGNAGDPMATVSVSAAAGVSTGAAVHGDLAFADLNCAVEKNRVHSH